MKKIICKIFGHYNKWDITYVSNFQKMDRLLAKGEFECSRCKNKFKAKKHISFVK